MQKMKFTILNLALIRMPFNCLNFFHSNLYTLRGNNIYAECNEWCLTMFQQLILRFFQCQNAFRSNKAAILRITGPDHFSSECSNCCEVNPSQTMKFPARSTTTVYVIINLQRMLKNNEKGTQWDFTKQKFLFMIGTCK